MLLLEDKYLVSECSLGGLAKEESRDAKGQVIKSHQLMGSADWKMSYMFLSSVCKKFPEMWF